MKTLGASTQNAKFYGSLDKPDISVDPKIEEVKWTNEDNISRVEQTFICETELTNSLFWVEEGTVPLHVLKPIRIRYYEKPTGDFLEVVGWDVQIPLTRSDDLPKLVPRRFLELFSKAQDQSLSEKEDAAFSEVCRQVDYRRFCASRRSSQYREARLIRKNRNLCVEFSHGSREELPPTILKKFHVLEEGDFFSGYFHLNSEGEVIDVERIQLLEDPLNLPDTFWTA